MTDLLKEALADAGLSARQAILHGFEERFSELETRIAARFQEARAEARREFAGKLNQALRQGNSEALVEAAGAFCGRAELFEVNSALLTAPAFASVIESRDPVVCVRTASELSEPVMKRLGESAAVKCHLFPIITRDRVAAVLYAESAVETEALELLAAIAGLVYIEPPRTLSPLHLKAQRFARVQAAKIRLKVKTGRGLKEKEIEEGREAYHRAFPSTPDYYELEVLRTLANDKD